MSFKTFTSNEKRKESLPQAVIKKKKKKSTARAVKEEK